MTATLKALNFERWVQFLFDHPVTEPAWHCEEDAETFDLTPNQLVEFATRLFRQSAEYLTAYSDAQIDQGLWFLVGESTSDLHILGEGTVPVADRLDCINAIAVLYQNCFVQRCSDHLSHLNEIGIGVLNSICYMWWDIFPLCADPNEPQRRAVDDACLSAMEKTLSIPSVACQESALHGLGHWASDYGGRCSAAIDAFLGANEGIRPELREYAMNAKVGNIL